MFYGISSGTYKICKYKIKKVLGGLNADPKGGRPFPEEVFKGELKEIEKTIKLDGLPFNPHDLHHINNSPKKDQEVIYRGSKVYLQRYLDLILNGEKELTMDAPSPWTWFVQKLSMERFSAIIVAPVCLIFSSALVLEDKRNRA